MSNDTNYVRLRLSSLGKVSVLKTNAVELDMKFCCDT